MKTPRGRVYLLATEKQVLIEMFAKLNEAGRPGAWSRFNVPVRGRPPAGFVNLPVRVPKALANRIQANANLRRQEINAYLGEIVKAAMGEKS